MFKHILAALGGPDPSLEPARVPARLASQLGASLTYVSVQKAPSAALGEPALESIEGDAADVIAGGGGK